MAGWPETDMGFPEEPLVWYGSADEVMRVTDNEGGVEPELEDDIGTQEDVGYGYG